MDDCLWCLSLVLDVEDLNEKGVPVDRLVLCGLCICQILFFSVGCVTLTVLNGLLVLTWRINDGWK